MLQLVQRGEAAKGVLRLRPHVVVAVGRDGRRLIKGHLHFVQVWTGEEPMRGVGPKENALVDFVT